MARNIYRQPRTDSPSFWNRLGEFFSLKGAADCEQGTDSNVMERAISAFRTDQRKMINFWGMIVRLGFATGLALYLTMDALAISFQPIPSLTFLLVGYTSVNGLLWYALPSGLRVVPWIYAGIDVLALVGALIVLPASAMPDPVFVMVALFAVLLMYYAVYGNPSLNASLSLGALGLTTALLFTPVPGLEAYHTNGEDAIQGFLMLQYVSIACLVTCLLALYLRKLAYSHGTEIMRRKKMAVEAATERTRRQEAERLDELKRDFIRVISHELRNPITPLRSSLDMMSTQMAEGIIDKEMLAVSIKAASSIEELINDYTRLARLLTQQEEAVTKCNIRLHVLLQELLEDLPSVRADLTSVRQLNTCANPVLLTEALRALLRRAAQQLEEHQSLRLGGERSNGHVRLSIHNAGDTFSQSEEMLDDPFSPLEERVYFSEGTGLELILARHGLRQLGGRLEVQQADVGTVITCHLPPENNNAPWVNSGQLKDVQAWAA